MKRSDLRSRPEKHLQANKIVIVAIGDSLTVGYHSPATEGWMEPTPYTTFLERRLGISNSQQKSLKFEIQNKGVSGELTSEMLARFDRDVVRVKPDIAIVLGGSNDIGWGVAPTDVFTNLASMYDAASKSGIETVACSIPSILGCDLLIPPRIELNEMIKAYCIERRIAFVDVFRATADPRTNGLLNEYSNDGLHLNARGYQRIADTIFEEALEALLSKRIFRSQ